MSTGGSGVPKTPFFVIDISALDSQVDFLRQSLEAFFPEGMAAYSFKTNALPWIVDHMRDAGLWAEVVSADEYELAWLAGFGSKIVYNGPVKSRETFIDALASGCVVNIDSWRELRWLRESLGSFGRTPRVGLRMGIDLEGRCPGASQEPDEGGRFGFSLESGAFKEAVGELRSMGIEPAGLHAHCSSKTRGLGVYRAIAEASCEASAELGLVPDFLDIGGGFFGGVEGKPAFPDYFREVSSVIRRSSCLESTKVIVEPGMSLIGPVVDYVASVVDVKDNGRVAIVTTDGSRTAVDPLMRKLVYDFEVRRQAPAGRRVPLQVLCGFTCMEADRILRLRDTGLLHEGDEVVFHKVGAYTMCLSPLFIDMFPDVWAAEGNELKLVRSRWTEDIAYGRDSAR